MCGKARNYLEFGMLDGTKLTLIKLQLVRRMDKLVLRARSGRSEYEFS